MEILWQRVPERTGGECFGSEAKEKHEVVAEGRILGEQRLGYLCGSRGRTERRERGRVSVERGPLGAWMARARLREV